MRDNYKIYKSDVILSNIEIAKQNCVITQNEFNKKYTGKDSTWYFSDYNLFNMTSTSMFFYDLYKELNFYVRDYIGDDRPAWMCAWLNSHKQDEVLDWHYHDCQYHGYIVIDKHWGDNSIKTKTVFRNWEIQNEVGNVYMGYSGFDHKVEVLQPYDGYRHTIAFQVTTEKNVEKNISYFPLL